VGGSWPLSICRVVLACAVGVGDAKEFALCHLEVEVVHGRKFAKLFYASMCLYGVQCITCVGLTLVLVVYLVIYNLKFHLIVMNKFFGDLFTSMFVHPGIEVSDIHFQFL